MTGSNSLIESITFANMSVRVVLDFIFITKTPEKDLYCSCTNFQVKGIKQLFFS